jgi:hypothetical protein
LPLEGSIGQYLLGLGNGLQGHEGDAQSLEAGDLTHSTSGLMKPEEGLAQVLVNDQKLGEGEFFLGSV